MKRFALFLLAVFGPGGPLPAAGKPIPFKADPAARKAKSIQ